MGTILCLRLVDSTQERNIIFEDFLTIPFDTPEALFKAVFGRGNMDVPRSDIWSGFDNNGNPKIEINFQRNRHYSFHNYAGLEMCNEVTYFFEKTRRVLSKPKYFTYEDEITDKEVFAALDRENRKEGVASQKYYPTEEDEVSYIKMEAEKYYQFVFDRNEFVEFKIKEVAEDIIRLTGQEAFDYLLELIMSDKNRIIEQIVNRNLGLDSPQNSAS